MDFFVSASTPAYENDQFAYVTIILSLNAFKSVGETIASYKNDKRLCSETQA